MDHVLRAGEVLLVPGGAPHRVRNGESDDDDDVSIAIAANFVDASNHAAALRDLELMARRSPTPRTSTRRGGGGGGAGRAR